MPRPRSNPMFTFQHTEKPKSTADMASTSHMEAYILRPLIVPLTNSSSMSYHIEQLPLEEDDMRRHAYQEGRDIIDAIGELLPDQLRMIQERAKARNGNLTRVQYGAEVELASQMGVVKVKPVIFVVKTGAEKEKERAKENKNRQQSTSWAPAPTPQAKLLEPGMPTNHPFGQGRPYPSERGYFEEKDVVVGPNAVQQYMSITFLPHYKQWSFEELRLAEYYDACINDLDADLFDFTIHTPERSPKPSQSSNKPAGQLNKPFAGPTGPVDWNFSNGAMTKEPVIFGKKTGFSQWPPIDSTRKAKELDWGKKNQEQYTPSLFGDPTRSRSLFNSPPGFGFLLGNNGGTKKPDTNVAVSSAATKDAGEQKKPDHSTKVDIPSIHKPHPTLSEPSILKPGHKEEMEKDEKRVIEQ